MDVQLALVIQVLLPDPVDKTVIENDLIVSAVLSGNRNFEGRIHPLVKANWLASPPLLLYLH